MSNIPVSALNSALSGLNIAQQLLDVTSENIANAQTVGYTAKTLPVEAQLANGAVVGTLTGNVTRNVNTALQASVWQQNALSGSSTAINTALSNIQSLYGTTASGTDFSSDLTTLKDDFTQLSGDPSNPTLQAQTVADAQTFAQTLNTTAATITTARNSAESGITSTVSTINTQLATIATLNQQIASVQGSGESTADLEDQRDEAVTALSSQINISTYKEASGVMVVQTTNGIVLADTTARSLSFTAQPIGASSAYPTNLSGVYVGSGNTKVDLAASPTSTGGTLGGLLQLRDQILPQQQAELDEVAEQTASRFNAQGVKLFTDGAGNIPATTPATGYVGLATDLQVNTAVMSDPSLIQQGTTPDVPPATALDPGDTSIIDNVLSYTFGLNSDSSGTPNTPFNVTGVGINGNISLTSLPSAATLETFSQDAMADQANQASSATSQSNYNSSYATTLQTNLENGSAVNLDNEVANLTVYENAYSCAAQVVSTEQKLMTDLLGILQ